MHVRHVAIAAILATFIGMACRKSQLVVDHPREPETQPAPSASGVRHRLFAGGVSPAIVSIKPDTLPLRSGHAYTEHYALEYDVQGIEKVKSARIVLYSPGIGQVQSVDIPVAAHGTVEFILDIGNIDFGPTLRLRAKCPKGSTDWYTLGAPPVPYEQRMSDAFQIGNVTPQSIPALGDDAPAGAAVELMIWGKQLDRDCTAEAELDGAPVELKNIYGMDKQIRALLPRSDLQKRPIAARFLEVKLQLLGPGVAVEDITRLNFREL